MRKYKTCGSILLKLSSAHDMEIKENREYFTKICEIIKYLCKQGLALRGHDESLESKNKGNFVELCELQNLIQLLSLKSINKK